MRDDDNNAESMAHFWHNLPWNVLFWATILIFLSAASLFAIGALRHRAKQQGIGPGEVAEIADGETVKVVLILNGDELLVEKDKRRARVRMLGIRSFDPVVNEKAITGFGQGAVRFLETRLLNNDVTMHFDKPIKDVRGRYLAYVHIGDVDIGRRMISKGVSFVYTEYKTLREQDYLIQEISARREPSGVWTSPKAAKRMLGLRHEWSNARQQRDGSRPADPLTDPGMGLDK